MLWILLIVGLVILAFGIISAYNTLIALKNQVMNAWKQIDVQLKRRHDLIPNLVNTVKGAMEFERGTLEAVISARNRAVAATSVKETARAEGHQSEYEYRPERGHLPSWCAVVMTGIIALSVRLVH